MPLTSSRRLSLDSVRSDGLEEKEARATMFQVPHRIPVGYARDRMSNAEYMYHAAPAHNDCYHHEHKVQNLLAEQGRDIHTGDAAEIFTITSRVDREL